MTRRPRSTTWILIALVALFTAFGLWFAQREHSAREEALAPTPVASESEREATVLTQPDAKSASRADATEPAIPTPSDQNAFLRVVPEKDPRRLSRSIRGIVVRRSGEPATQAVVWFGETQAATDEHGGFEFPYPMDWRDRMDMWPLVAIEAGSQAAILPEFGLRLRESAQDPTPLRLVLGPPTLSIRGHILDSSRRPLGGCVVTLMTSTSVMVGNPSGRTVEQLAAGEATDGKTDAEGAFELTGLFDRTYRLQAFDDKTLARLESNDIPAGSDDVELVFPPDALVPEITGRVVGRDGIGIGGAYISMVVVSERRLSPDGASGGFGSASSMGRIQGSTAADGSFRVENAPRFFAKIRVHGKDLIDRRVSLDDLDIKQPVKLVVDRACKFRLEGLPANDDPLYLLALDAEQKELRVLRSPGSHYAEIKRLQLGNDPAEIYTVSEAAIEFVLSTTDGTVLGRRPARLVPGSVSLLAW